MHPRPVTLESRSIVVGVDGGPRAFEAADLVRRLVKAGAEVRVAVTARTEGWLPALTLETLSRAAVARTPEDAQRLADAELLVIAPCGADLLAGLVRGRTDDAVAALFARMSDRAVVVPGPEVPSAGWVAANLSALAETALVLPAGSAPETVAREAARRCGPRDLAGRRVVITAGPTREHLDPVRFLSNPSSGRMGYALAERAARRGASVVLVSGPVERPAPAGVRRVSVVSAQEMADAVAAERAAMDLFVGVAAVADWRPAEVAGEKEKKEGRDEKTVRLVRTPDILATVSAETRGRADRPVIVGFAAETERVVEHAREKLERKGVDLVVANDVKGPEGAFGAETNEVVLVSETEAERVPRATKGEIAEAILDRAVRLLDVRRPQAPGAPGT